MLRSFLVDRNVPRVQPIPEKAFRVRRADDVFFAGFDISDNKGLLPRAYLEADELHFHVRKVCDLRGVQPVMFCVSHQRFFCF